MVYEKESEEASADVNNKCVRGEQISSFLFSIAYSVTNNTFTYL